MRKIFISSPYSADSQMLRTANVIRSMDAAEVLFRNGFEPMCPLLWHYYDELKPGRTWQQWINTCLTWLPSCDALVRLSGPSQGADIEVAEAMKLGIPVFFGLEDLLKYFPFGKSATEESSEVPDIKIQLLPGGKLPTRATDGAAGYDLYIAKRILDGPRFTCLLGIQTEIPPGYCAKIYPRSGLAHTGWMLGNSVGIIDSDYRGEWTVKFTYTGRTPSPGTPHSYPKYYAGDRVAQFTIEKIQPFTMTVVEELSETARGEGGFGSTGK